MAGSSFASEQDKAILKDFKQNYAGYTAGMAKVLGLIKSGQLRTTSDANKAVAEYKDETYKMEEMAKKLAERTAKATSEIAGMINAIQNEVSTAVTSMGEATSKVEIGTQDVARAGTALANIVKSVDGLGSMIHQIASATEEMATVSDTINSDIESIARVSHETSASSGQIAHASSDLARLASNLQRIIGHFKV